MRNAFVSIRSKLLQFTFQQDQRIETDTHHIKYMLHATSITFNSSKRAMPWGSSLFSSLTSQCFALIQYIQTLRLNHRVSSTEFCQYNVVLQTVFILKVEVMCRSPESSSQGDDSTHIHGSTKVAPEFLCIIIIASTCVCHRTFVSLLLLAPASAGLPLYHYHC